MSTNNFPLVWNTEADDGLLGSLFPQSSNFGRRTNSNENIWKEEWKTRTMTEIQDYFFPEAKIKSKNKITICDTTEAFQDIKIENNQTSENAQPLDEIIIETYGVGRIPLDLGNMAIYFFTSSDGARLIRARRCAYESRAKNPDVLAVFMETDEGGNIFGSVMDFVVGDNVRALFKDDYWEKIFDFLENNDIHVSRKDTEDLIKKGLSHENFLDYIKRIANDLIAKVSFAVFDAMAEGFGQIAKGIGSWKFNDEEWDATHENFSASNAPFIFMELDFTQLKKIRYKNSEVFEKIIADFRATVDAHQKKIPDLILKPMQSFIELLQEKTKLFFKTFEENASLFVNLIRQNNENMNAFLCGFINGFLDFIKSIFDLFAFAFKFAKAATDFALNESYYWNLILEYLENGIDALSKFDILDFFKKTFTLPIEILARFMGFLTNLALPSVNLSKIYYFSGYVLLGIVQIVLEIIFTGGSVSIERLFAKSAAIIKGFVKKAGSFADDVFRSLDKLISLIKKGSQNFASFIRKIFDDFFEWLKGLFKNGKADEALEEAKRPVKGFSESDLDWMASRKIGNLGGNILKASQIRKLRGLLKEKGIHLIVEGDAKSITRLFAPIEDFRSIDDLFYVMRNEGFPGGFNAHTKQFYLSKNATEIVGFHEMAHFKHFEEVGEAYLTLSKLEKETYVWEQILANGSKWTKAELQDALKYINRVRKKAGIKEPLKIKI